MHFDEEMGFQHLGLHCQIQGPPQYVSIRSSFCQAVTAAALGWAALGSHLQTKIWHFGQAFAT